MTGEVAHSAAPPAPRVVVVDDDRLARECLAAELVRNGVRTDSAWDIPSLLAQTDSGAPALILLNIRTADADTMLQMSLDIDTVVTVMVFGLSVDRESEVVACAEAGVGGLHLATESFEHLLTMVRNAEAGRAQCSPEVSAILLRRAYALAGRSNPVAGTGTLTAREKEILELLEHGLTNQQIASRLSVTLHTVKNHVHSMLTKLGVRSRAEAVAVFRAAKFTGPGAA